MMILFLAWFQVSQENIPKKRTPPKSPLEVSSTRISLAASQVPTLSLCQEDITPPQTLRQAHCFECAEPRHVARWTDLPPPPLINAKPYFEGCRIMWVDAGIKLKIHFEFVWEGILLYRG